MSSPIWKVVKWQLRTGSLVVRHVVWALVNEHT